MQSASPQDTSPFHVAIIMDGNGRWANRRGLPRAAGHRAGARVVRDIVEAAPELGLTTLTLYAMSSDNFGRPAAEVAALLRLFAEYLGRETGRLVEQGVRLEVIGRRDRLPHALATAVARAEQRTAGGTTLRLRLAIDYSARTEILRAAERLAASGARDGNAVATAFDAWPDVDLLVRSGGERRLSDFLLWECAYAELAFIDRLWPDFTRHDLEAAVAEFRGRDRRYGLVREAVARGA
jgi:undecaprenyl diphosphate synthase